MITSAPLPPRFMSLSVLSLCISLAACGGSDTPEDIAGAEAQTLETPAAMNVAGLSATSTAAGAGVALARTGAISRVGSNPTRLVAVATAPVQANPGSAIVPPPVLVSSDSPTGTPPASRDTSPTRTPPTGDSPIPQSGIVLDGSGVAAPYTPGCHPTLFADFVDSASWSGRRLEPRDCAIVNAATPVFSWTQPYDRDLSRPWSFELRDAQGKLVASRSTPTPRLLLADTVLQPGSYKWTASYRNKSGATLTSASRRFSVSAQGAGVTVPSASTIASLAASKPHPRALPVGASFPDIKAAALGGEYNAAFNAYLKAAATYRAEAPPAVPADRTRADFSTDMEYQAWLKTLPVAASNERKAIETLGYAAYFTGDPSYALAGLARLENLAKWPTRGATSEANQDQANREIYVGLAFGLDLYADRLSASQTAAVVAALKDRVRQAMEKWPSLDPSPYQGHQVNASRFVLMALLSAVGAPGMPEAQNWLMQAWDLWITTSGTWGADGEYGNSTNYVWYAGIPMAQTAAMVRLVTNTDLSRWPDISKYGSNMIAFTAPAIKLQSVFGDGVETVSNYEWYSKDFYRLYAAVTRSPANEWYWRVKPDNVIMATPLPAQHYMMLGLNLPAVSAAPPTTNSWVFEDAGQVAMHSSTADPYRSSLFFRSSRFGTDVHSVGDNNGFVFVSKGQPLFINGGYYPYYMSPHHAMVGRATRFKNALTFDGGIGQAEPSATPTGPGKTVLSMDARGQLINFHDSGVWAVATGDATLAYRGQDQTTRTWSPLLTHAVRTVAYNRSEKVAVIYDWATSEKLRTWELNFQMLNAPSIDRKTLRAIAGSAEGCVDVYNLPGEFKVTKGFPIAPENGLPDQYQARYAASKKSKELVAITVIREDCRSVRVDVAVTATSASVAIAGTAPLAIDRTSVRVP